VPIPASTATALGHALAAFVGLGGALGILSVCLGWAAASRPDQTAIFVAIGWLLVLAVWLGSTFWVGRHAGWGLGIAAFACWAVAIPVYVYRQKRGRLSRRTGEWAPAFPTGSVAGIVVAFGLAVLLGLYLVWVGGWPILVIGVLSILAGLAYTGGPWPFGYHGLGDVFVFVFFGLVAVMGSAYLQTGRWTTLAAAAAVPVGLLVTNILVVNNLRDLPTDRDAGKRTLAVRLGDRATRVQYALFTALAYLSTAALALSGEGRRWILLPWLTLPLGIALTRRVTGGLAGRDLNPMLERTGKLLLAFGVLLAVGLMMAGAWRVTGRA